MPAFFPSFNRHFTSNQTSSQFLEQPISANNSSAAYINISPNTQQFSHLNEQTAAKALASFVPSFFWFNLPKSLSDFQFSKLKQKSVEQLNHAKNYIYHIEEKHFNFIKRFPLSVKIAELASVVFLTYKLAFSGLNHKDGIKLFSIYACSHLPLSYSSIMDCSQAPVVFYDLLSQNWQSLAIGIILCAYLKVSELKNRGFISQLKARTLTNFTSFSLRYLTQQALPIDPKILAPSSHFFSAISLHLKNLLMSSNYICESWKVSRKQTLDNVKDFLNEALVLFLANLNDLDTQNHLIAKLQEHFHCFDKAKKEIDRLEDLNLLSKEQKNQVLIIAKRAFKPSSSSSDNLEAALVKEPPKKLSFRGLIKESLKKEQCKLKQKAHSIYHNTLTAKQKAMLIILLGFSIVAYFTYRHQRSQA